MVDVTPYNSNVCVICQQGSTNLVPVGDKELDAILDYCKQRSNQSLEPYLQACKHATPDVKVFVHVFVDEISQTHFLLIIMRCLYSYVGFIRLKRTLL